MTFTEEDATLTCEVDIEEMNFTISADNLAIIVYDQVCIELLLPFISLLTHVILKFSNGLPITSGVEHSASVFELFLKSSKTEPALVVLC